jgi:hypothetical protein
MSYATTMSLVILLVSSASVSLTYVEFYWWIMLLPVCLDRALDQRLAERKTLAKTPEASA